MLERNDMARQVKQVQKVTFEPGNGTRYDLFCIQFSEGADLGTLGAVEKDGWLVVCGLNGKAYLFSSQGYLTPDYVAEKLDIPEFHAAPVTYSLGVAINRPVFVA